MKVINPLNRVPETEETMVMSCACICYSGSATAKAWGSSGNTCAAYCNTSIPYNNSCNLDMAAEYVYGII